MNTIKYSIRLTVAQVNLQFLHNTYNCSSILTIAPVNLQLFHVYLQLLHYSYNCPMYTYNWSSILTSVPCILTIAWYTSNCFSILTIPEILAIASVYLQVLQYTYNCSLYTYNCSIMHTIAQWILTIALVYLQLFHVYLQLLLYTYNCSMYTYSCSSMLTIAPCWRWNSSNTVELWKDCLIYLQLLQYTYSCSIILTIAPLY